MKSSAAVKLPNTKTIAIVQLKRAGDLLQTYQAAVETKRHDSSIRLILIARKNFSQPLKFLLKNCFDQIIEFDRQNLLRSHETLASLRSALEKIIQEINYSPINVLINLSFCKTSSFLCSAISAEHKLGPFRDHHANLVINDKWSQYLYGVVMTDSFNPFHLVDLFCFILGVRNSNSKDNFRGEAKKVQHLVIHPFASQQKKMWKMVKWAEIIFQILTDNPQVKISLVGSPNEKLLAEQLVTTPILNRFVPQINNYVGEYDLEEVFHLLSTSQLFLGHDSMIGHLASIAKIQSLTISAGTVRSEETTPYGANNYNLVPVRKCFPCFPSDPCKNFECHSDIPCNVTNFCVNQLINNQEINADELQKGVSSFHLHSMDLKKSHFTNANLFKLMELTAKTSDLKNMMKIFYRISFLYFNANCEENTDFPRLNELGHQELLSAMEGLKHLYELYNFGKKYSQYVLEELARDIPNISTLHELSGKIDEISYLLDLVKQTNPTLSPIINLHKLAQGNLPGKNIVEITENSFLTYNDYSILVQAIYELAESTILEHKGKNKTASTRKDFLANT